MSVLNDVIYITGALQRNSIMVLEMDFVSVNIMADLIHSFTFKVHGYETFETCNNRIHIIKLYESCSTTSIYGNKNTSLPLKIHPSLSLL